ncbi:cytochrome P450 [Parvibaculum sp.]|jgi:cytochrome P450|uniref:cytochrome P450 n=1 Tax=Parvibaculum sp. TaxID=2024848 RepID=UPI001B094924|nr:cytochrome P450 [Parvibaculum sp.]MBO6633772.1 cytochrome P450 [Parvibaculum sp.]MBO6677621.1 cytochrome P450 [Parvibaculum sp.]MBO6684327.1 cytochrome P450 [Parvibaculum sp.]MBO6904913.1 cytochrome P450 [Parvibaculum sp.]
MSDAAVKYEADEARDAAYSTPLEEIDVADPLLFKNNTMWPYFERLRSEAPVHYCTKNEEAGPYWSVTRYKDIMAVDTNHQVFSSEGGITLRDQDEDFKLPMFIAMDPPKHDEQRKTVSPIVAPANLAKLEGTIRERAGNILDSLPEGKPFNWVDKVSIELTTQMLATLFDFPFEERRKLTRWSDVATASEDSGIIESEEARRAELLECADYFIGLWNERVNAKEPGNDLISMLAHGESTRNMDKMEYLGNLILLIVGGNDTTRNSISGGLLALNQFPDQYAKLQANPSVIPNMVAEIIRWQTPLAYMRRTALEDTEISGTKIAKGDKVAMWYVSGNRDETVIENPNELVIDRDRARQHLSFGFGIHRCVGNRLAEMQLRIIWEEILKRWPDKQIKVLSEPRRVHSSFVKGYEELMVEVPKRSH